MAHADCESVQTLDLTEEEAFALLLMCLMSPMKLDAHAESAMRKLAEYCKHKQYYEEKEESEAPSKWQEETGA